MTMDIGAAERLNYHHLRYFWAAALAGGIGAAARRLGVSQPTVSAQVQALEESLDVQLIVRRGAAIELTDAGRAVLRHADGIFRLGEDMLGAVAALREGAAPKLAVGTSDAVPKPVVRALLQEVAEAPKYSVVCREWRSDHLLAALAVHRLDLVVTDAPVSLGDGPRAVSHPAGDEPVALYAESSLARRLRRGFPGSLDGAPIVLPAENVAVRHGIDRWLEAVGVQPRIVAETEDRALATEFGVAGSGVFPFAPGTGEAPPGTARVGWMEGVRERCYVVAVERGLPHPGAAVVLAAAKARAGASARRKKA